MSAHQNLKEANEGDHHCQRMDAKPTRKVINPDDQLIFLSNIDKIVQ
jgi:hypothetical protein